MTEYHWPYFRLVSVDDRFLLIEVIDHTYLMDDDGATPVEFKDSDEAEKYLVDSDIRGTVI